MRSKLYALFMGACALLTVTTASAFSGLAIVVPVNAPATVTPVNDPVNPLSKISAKEFLKLTPAKYQQMTGKKMTLKEKIQLKMVQMKVKKMVKRGEVVTMADVQKKFEDVGTMNILGFLLGLILGPIGVIIALILKESGNVSPSFLRWSLYGLLVWLAIVLVAFIL